MNKSKQFIDIIGILIATLIISICAISFGFVSLNNVRIITNALNMISIIISIVLLIFFIIILIYQHLRVRSLQKQNYEFVDKFTGKMKPGAGYRDLWMLLFLIVTVSSLCYSLYMASGPHFSAFNSHDWKSVKSFSENYSRLRMVDFLKNNYKLTQISENELLERLGSPSLSASDTKRYFPEWDLVYWMGESSGARRRCREHAWLAFKKDGQIVSRYEVIHDYCSYIKF